MQGEIAQLKSTVYGFKEPAAVDAVANAEASGLVPIKSDAQLRDLRTKTPDKYRELVAHLTMVLSEDRGQFANGFARKVLDGNYIDKHYWPALPGTPQKKHVLLFGKDIVDLWSAVTAAKFGNLKRNDREDLTSRLRNVLAQIRHRRKHYT